ncbi:hypothetical protein [Paenibacillus gansuensis]|uniref:Aerobactin siderophore biosynthesis IucA/IucC-like C-terminal domain-containing protein n=1 Tax=Paenibacillus gansuensis TaxID=306542 RepID=A0ABW5PA58_9BACL
MLTQEELARIEKQYGLYLGRRPAGTAAVHGSALAVPDSLAAFISIHQEALQAPRAAVAASLFTKSYARALCGLLDLWYVHRLAPLPQLNALEVISNGLGGIMLHADPSMLTAVNHETKGVTGNHVFRQIASDHLQPVLESIHKHYHLKLSLLWENAYIYLANHYKLWATEAASEQKKTRIRDDWEFIRTSEFPLDLPGKLQDHPLHPGTTFRVRSSCCQKHLLPAGISCTVCPLVTEEERAKILSRKG